MADNRAGEGEGQSRIGTPGPLRPCIPAAVVQHHPKERPHANEEATADFLDGGVPVRCGHQTRDGTGLPRLARRLALVLRNRLSQLHDLRHTAATKMAEAGVPENTMLALMGHMSRSMLERYSHIRMAAKRQAVEALTIAHSEHKLNEVPTKIPTTIPLAKM